MGRNSSRKKPVGWLSCANQWRAKYCDLNFLKDLIFTTKYLSLVSVVLLLTEALLCIFVVQTVKYTEIDWVAYMQEVEGFLNGTLDYSQLRGDTGPLVYPAGFVYIYSVLYYATSRGSDVRIAQYIFIAIYLILLSLVFRIYIRTKKVPSYVLILMSCTSYRIHSIFILRLFNDPIAVLLLFGAINLFLDGRWYFGSVVYSLAVSVKMNILLFAPALLVAYCCCLGARGAASQLFVCAAVQLVLGAPFLYADPVAYLQGSFDFGRVFDQKWTVNYRFLPEHVFVSPLFHLSLLAAHVATVLAFTPAFLTYLKSYANLKRVETDLKCQSKVDMSSVAQLFVFPLFVANFIGVVFSRSLHYQFYVWYYHSLPYLLWCTDLSVPARLTILGLIELSWNTYPSTELSAALHHLSHSYLLYRLYTTCSTRIKDST